MGWKDSPLVEDKSQNQGGWQSGKIVAPMVLGLQQDTNFTINPEDFDPGFWETETGQLVGGITGGVRGAVYGSAYGPWGTIVGGVVGAAIGGGVGEGGQQVYQTLTDNPYAPENIDESLSRILEAGGEEALYDLAGGLFFKAGSAAWRFVRPKPIDGVEAVNKTLKEYGGSLSAAQMTDNSLVQTIEGLSQAAWGGQPLRELRALNDVAIEKYVDNYVDHFSGIAGENLTEEGLGRLYVSLIETGKTHYKAVGTDLFNKLDDLYKPLIQTKKVIVHNPTGIVDESGRMLNRTTVQVVEEEVLPVSTKELKKVAEEILSLTKGTKHSSLGDWGGKTVKDVLGFDDTLSFAAAQEYRSGLLADLRAADSSVKLGEGKAKMLLTKFEKAIDSAMEKGALATNNEEFINSWRFAAKYWKTGKNTIANKQISSLIRKNPEVIGDTIFSIGNVTQIKEARKALRYAAAYSKGTDDAFEFSQAWKQMQSGYLRGVLAKAKDASKVKLTEVPAGLQESLGVKTKEVSAGELSIAKLKSLFIEGTPQNRTMLNAFTDQQRSALKTFINTVEKAQKRPQAAGEFMVTVGQAGLVLNTFGAFGPATMEATEFSGDLALYTIGPYILSKLLVNPRYARLISKGINAKPTSPQAGAIVAKIIAAATNIDALGE